MEAPQEMSGLSLAGQDLCICHNLHVYCNPESCHEAAKSPKVSPEHDLPRIFTMPEKIVSMSALKMAAVRGCPFCALMYDGLQLPAIRPAWRHPAVKDEDLEVTFLDRRVNIRVAKNGNPENAGDWKHFAFYRQPGEMAESSPCHAFPIATSLSESTFSETSWKNLRSWLGECDGHEACKRNGFSPKRVLDIGSRNEMEKDVRLLCDSDLEGGKYTTLSYRWGTEPFIQTTMASLDKRKEGIKWSQLPKTFQDAITITRMLDVRYIWIDSLCILQDDLHDWEIQSSKMESIYRNSYLTIAATHAYDSHGGCFADTKGVSEESSHEIHPSSSVRIRTLNRDDHFEFGHTWARFPSPKPLMSRGWAFQERLLSPRTVHYMKTELVWECNTKADCQCGCIHVMTPFKNTYARSLGQQDIISRTHDWIWIVEVYTDQNLTHQSDRLPAISGLARQAQQAGWGDYAAGLWRQHLDYLATWEVRDTREARKYKEYLGPSWSWVNITGAIRFPFDIGFNLRWGGTTNIQIQDVHISTGEDPTGKVIDGHMVISGQSLEATLSAVEATASQESGYNLTIAIGEVYDNFIPDTRDTLGMLSGNVPVKIVPWCSFNRVDGFDMLFMVLGSARKRDDLPLSSTTRIGAFERLGLFTITGDEDDPNHKGRRWTSQATEFKDLVIV